MDIVEVPRIEAALKKRKVAFAGRVFSDAERAYCEKQKKPAEHYAARWAAKEAFFKALGTGKSAGLRFRDVEVLRDKEGAPRLKLRGAAQKLFDEKQCSASLVSLSRSASLAAAVVLLTVGSGQGLMGSFE